MKRATWIDPSALDARVREAVESVAIVDAHEHLDEEAVRLGQEINLTRFFMYYTFDEIASAGGIAPGAEGEFWKPGVSGDDQWRMIRGAWPRVRHSAYGRSVILSIRELYGIDDLRDDTIRPLLEAVEKRNRPGVLEWILRDKCNLECCLVNANDPGDLARRTASPGLFLFDISVSEFMNDSLDLEPFERASGIEAKSLRGWVRMMEWYFSRWGDQAAAVKNVCAYWRTLKFDDVPEGDAERLFEKWLVKKEADPAERKAVQDHFFHRIIRMAIDRDLPVKIHTGYHAGHNYSDMDIFRARNLSGVFRRHPGARFDLFHIGYPEWHDVVALAKHYSNVFANMCWAWVIDAEAAMDFARHALAALPVNKVIGFGGDYGFADTVYGHARIARDGFSKVLTEAVRDGRLSRKEAAEVARRWLRENAMDLYRIPLRRENQAKSQPPPLSR